MEVFIDKLVSIRFLERSFSEGTVITLRTVTDKGVIGETHKGEFVFFSFMSIFNIKRV